MVWRVIRRRCGEAQLPLVPLRQKPSFRRRRGPSLIFRHSVPHCQLALSLLAPDKQNGGGSNGRRRKRLISPCGRVDSIVRRSQVNFAGM
jgi:hypothetical protein